MLIHIHPPNQELAEKTTYQEDLFQNPLVVCPQELQGTSLLAIISHPNNETLLLACYGCNAPHTTQA